MSGGEFDIRTWLVGASYLVAATLFLLGLQRMASPVTARSGIRWAGLGMLVATAATLFLPGLHNLGLILVAALLGTVAAWIWGRKVAITDMPEMVALFNGMGGGSAAAIGAVSLSGSVIAWAKLDGHMDRRYTFPGQQAFNALLALATVVLGAVAAWSLGAPWIIAFFTVALALGVLMTLPIGGADMPVV